MCTVLSTTSPAAAGRTHTEMLLRLTQCAHKNCNVDLRRTHIVKCHRDPSQGAEPTKCHAPQGAPTECHVLRGREHFRNVGE